MVVRPEDRAALPDDVTAVFAGAWSQRVDGDELSYTVTHRDDGWHVRVTEVDEEGARESYNVRPDAGGFRIGGPAEQRHVFLDFLDAGNGRRMLFATDVGGEEEEQHNPQALRGHDLSWTMLIEVVEATPHQLKFRLGLLDANEVYQRLSRMPDPPPHTKRLEPLIGGSGTAAHIAFTGDGNAVRKFMLDLANRPQMWQGMDDVYTLRRPAATRPATKTRPRG